MKIAITTKKAASLLGGCGDMFPGSLETKKGRYWVLSVGSHESVRGGEGHAPTKKKCNWMHFKV